MFQNYKTSNPAFSNYFWNTKDQDQKMSVLGIFFKSMFCIVLVTVSVAFIWFLFSEGKKINWYTAGGFIAALIISIVISVKMEWSKYLVPLYSLAKGLFLGGISCYAHQKFPFLPFQAVGVTIISFFVMLLLYQLRIIVVTKKLRSIIISSIIIIMVVYISAFVLSLFGINASFVFGTSYVAIGFNIFAAITASFSLLLDFDYIERYKNKASKDKEWFATWGLLVTLVWLYIEALRLLKKLAIRF